MIGPDYFLSSLTALESLSQVGESIIILNNILISLTGLEGISIVNKHLQINGDAIQSLSGLENINEVTGSISLTSNESLLSLDGLNGVVSAGKIYLASNPKLTSLSGLDKLTTISGDLWIRGNHSLVSLSGLDSLISIGGKLEIGASAGYGNPSLEALDGLDNLDYTTIESLVIRHNSKLSICNSQLICDYLENGGEAEIHNNAPGCNSQQEVEEACGIVLIDDLIFEDKIQLFPNPTAGIIQVSTPDKAEWMVSIRDAMGKLVVPFHQLLNGEIDLSALPSGWYFIDFNDGRHTVTIRIVKQ